MMKTMLCRTFQTGMRYGAYCLPWREPIVISGVGSFAKLPGLVRLKRIRAVLVVTDATLVKLGLVQPLLTGLKEKGIRYALYDKTVPNPTIDNVEEALALYKQNGCGGIIAMGGGSPMDCAKVVGARVARPNLPVSKMKGLFRILKTTPPLFAVPTTSGTGSETTLAAVIVDSRTHEKYPINDFSLFPDYAILDPSLTVGLPPSITYTTGMDALTHAVEAYIGSGNTAKTRQHALRATRLIFANILTASREGQNLAAREAMQQASYDAGVAFTRAYVGNVHAIAHTLGGMYGIAHGLANTILLPRLLTYYGDTVYGSLAELADAAGLAAPGQSDEAKARHFIATIEDMNRQMDIPTHIPQIQVQDIPLMAKRADAEANPLYPVPVVLTRGQFERLYHDIRG